MHYFKYILKGLKDNLSRFIAVVAIVALGVGFLVGLLSATGDLHASVQKMYENQNMMDFNIKSSIGFDEQTIIELKKATNGTVEKSYQIDEKAFVKGQKLNTRFVCYDFDNASINKIELLEGRLPLNSKECVIIEDNDVYYEAKIGDTIEFDEVVYSIVGVIKSPLYFAKEREYTIEGTNRLDLIFYVDSKYQVINEITDVYISLDKDYEYFEDKYFNELKDYKLKIEQIKETELNRQKINIKNTIIEEISLNKDSIKELLIYNHILEGTSYENIDVEEYIITLASEKLEETLNKTGYEWYILDKKSNLSYISFSQNCDKINKIATVFPIFFYFIAALVALTTITRLVEEERTSIGLLKSLGYSKTKISMKYIFYGFVCSIIGSIIGVVLGIFILPYVIHVAFQTLYLMPRCVFVFDVLVNSLSVAGMILTILFVALYVSLKSLKEKPAALLLPKAPKPGKRILLEKIPFLWNKTKFKYKNTLRNIFRYKKNLIMMMIGVGGCVALLLCAFGIKESIGSLGSSQYKNILQYDLRINVDKNSSIDFDSIDGVEEYNYIYYEETYIKDDDDYLTYLIVTSKNLDSYFALRDLSGNEISVKENDVVISKQLADKFNLKKNSKVILDNGQEYIVTAICDNYVNNYIYIYTTNEFDRNSYLVNTLSGYDEEDIAEQISEFDNVSSIEIKSQLSTSFDAMADSLVLIILVVILCSGALAVIVIYNLTNININERVKEIATLKVLGYQRNEVCGYIYREVFILSLFGILTGFIIGPILFKFIMYNIQSPGLLFSDSLHPLYFLYAFIITIVFVLIVDLLFIPKIKNIKMVESLKCVD